MTEEQFNFFLGVLERIANAQEDTRDELQFLNSNIEKLLKQNEKVTVKKA